MLRSNTAGVLLMVVFLSAVCRGAGQDDLGFDDTPFLPNSPWRVHDRSRPQPPVLEPGETSAQPPSDAIVLFDGKDLSQWEDAKGGVPTGLEDGCINVLRSGDLFTKQKFGDCQLHVEWATPSQVDTKLRSWWGNSGVFFLAKYELQVTESRETRHKADGLPAAIYGQTPPLVNAARKPGQWQTYDVVFTAPRFDGDKLLEPACFTVFWNGVLAQYRTACMGTTRYKTVPKYDCHDVVGPIKLQQHGSAVRFRNIWVRPLQFKADAGPAPRPSPDSPAPSCQ
jgi:hypothetical protein